MSRTYRYVLFAPGKQPSVEEVAQLREWSAATKQRFAVGISNDSGGLAIAFDGTAFDAACSANGKFAKLLRHWKMRGCVVVDKLPFIKKPTALQPMPGGLLHEAVERRSEPVLKHKRLAAQEALGRAGLKFQQALAQHAWLHRVAAIVPYALMGFGGVLMIVLGAHLYQRLLRSPVERRQQTIHRVADDAMDEQLIRQSRQIDSKAALPAE